MKELPILFNRPMVRAILDGRKTQTRRVIKPQPDCKLEYGYLWHQRDKNMLWNNYSDKEFKAKCPYGQPGDRLWVRETWGLWDTEPKDGPDNAQIFYRASDENRRDMRYQKWRPSIHMPRWASRINLEITAVRVERLQDISVEDALSEGIGHGRVSPVLEFMELWDSINAPRGYSWDSNPWVWVVVFGRGNESSN